jgi:hypothetical protein
MTQQEPLWSDLYDSLGRPLDKMPDELHPGSNTMLINELSQVLLHRRSDNGALPGGRMEMQCVRCLRRQESMLRLSGLFSHCLIRTENISGFLWLNTLAC